MRTSFKLVKQSGGRGHFAIVRLSAQLAEAGVAVTQDIQPFDRALDHIEWESHVEWTRVAERGARAFCLKLVACGRVPGCRVVIERVAGLDVDTDDAGLACAASLATWQALLPQENLPPFEWREGQWHILF